MQIEHGKRVVMLQDSLREITRAEMDRANAIFVEVRIDSLELWIRGVTPEPFGLKTTRLERAAGFEARPDNRLSDRGTPDGRDRE